MSVAEIHPYIVPPNRVYEALIMETVGVITLSKHRLMHGVKRGGL